MGRLIAKTAVLALIGLTPAGCGDGTDPGLRHAVEGYSDAFLTGDGEAAYALLSQRCQNLHAENKFSQIVTQAADTYGTALAFVSYEEKIYGIRAEVTYTYSISSLDQADEPWVNEDGWKQNDC